ncbi:isoprenyl transferase [Clostridium pasteurianum]|uniref:Isoprenyl transferase n=1 Tax=Clostridium pasteurianum BC1 TaxID=86416 RepID=R4K7K2_CLOPA|nr:isoprenyl transferase [Clostridium pasteurianum]AGK97696.1 undecaprenyl diphosphate synthase [Clostridium pasteurianum BC1]
MDTIKIPKHIAIMMDGNGRWAKKRFMPRTFGHRQGSKTLENICKDTYDLGVEYLTVYAFSTENWSRPKDEVEGLMNLLKEYLNKIVKMSINNNMQVKIIGNVKKLDNEFQSLINNLEKATANCTGLKFQLALNYGGKDEIIRTTKKIALECLNNKIDVSIINEDLFASHLDTTDIPEPDLFIRTGGEKRLSNFLLWEMAYTELYFTDVLWPDFKKDDLGKAIYDFSKRDRRYGNVIE